VIIAGIILCCIAIFFPKRIDDFFGVIGFQAAVISAIDMKRIKEFPEWYAGEMKKILNSHKISFTFDTIGRTMNGFEVKFLLPQELEFIIEYSQRVPRVFILSGTMGPIAQENEKIAKEYITKIKRSVDEYGTITFPTAGSF
jgi:hypothetical protein